MNTFDLTATLAAFVTTREEIFTTEEVSIQYFNDDFIKTYITKGLFGVVAVSYIWIQCTPYRNKENNLCVRL